VLGLVVLGVLALAAPAAAGTELVVCDAHDQQNDPAISGRRVVWQDWRSGEPVIYARVLPAGPVRLVSRAPSVDSPDVSGALVAYERQGANAGVRVIRARNVRSGRTWAMPYGAADQREPAVWRGKVVWSQTVGDDTDIVLYDTVTGASSAICSAPSWQYAPDIASGIVVWEDYRNPATAPDIYGFDLASGTELPICVQPGSQTEPAVGSRFVVWTDTRRGIQGDIYGYDLVARTELVVCAAERGQRAPAVSGDLVVWEDTRHGSAGDIYGRALPTGRTFAVCRRRGVQFRPAVSGDRVVWVDGRDLTNNWNIIGRRL
jgi:beta propeller repeat protein